MQGEKVDPDDDQSSKGQSGDQTGRDSSDSVLSRSRSSEFRKSHSKSRTRKDQSKIVYFETGSSSEPLNKLWELHGQYDQHDVHTVKMEHPTIIKNTVQRKNPIIQERINQVRCKAKFAAFKPCRNRGRATRVEDVPVDTQRFSANDAKGTEYQSGEPREDFSGAVHR